MGRRVVHTPRRHSSLPTAQHLSRFYYNAAFYIPTSNKDTQPLKTMPQLTPTKPRETQFNTDKTECLKPVYVYNKRIVALWDTGSNHTIIGKSFFDHLPFLRQRLIDLKVPRQAVGLNGGTVLYNQKLEFPLYIFGRHSKPLRVSAYYSPAVKYTLILGYDFLTHNNIRMDFNEMSFTPRPLCKLHSHKTYTIPPQSEAIVWTTLGRNRQQFSFPTTGLVKPTDVIRRLGLTSSYAVVTLHNAKTKIPVKILNLMDVPITILKQTKLSILEELQNEDIIDDTNWEDSPSLHANSSKISSKKVRIAPTDKFINMFDFSESIFNSEQKSQLKDLLWEFEDVFHKPGDKLGSTDILKFDIQLKPDSRPFRIPPYRTNPRMRDEIEKQVNSMLKDDIIEPSVSPFSSPVVMVVKKTDQSLRFCVDFRKLNSITELDSHPLQRIDDSLESLGSCDASIFSTLDLNSGYWQIKMADDSKKYTAFATTSGLYQFKVMPFGLSNAPAVFTRLMTSVLRGLAWKTALVYLDDIIVLSRDFQDHMTNLRHVFQRLRSANLTLKPKKCCFGKQKIRFLGHLVSKDGLEPLPENCKAVFTYPTPTKVRDVRGFLGLCGYYRKFVKDFSKIAGPLTELTKKETKFVWSQDCEKAFQTLKQALVNPPILAYPDYNKPYLLQADASRDSVGMVLSQIQNGKERVISYAGKRLSPAQRLYHTTEKEALAIVLAFKTFDPYLRGNNTIVQSDHKALLWLMGQKQCPARIARWVCYLSQFDFTIGHKPGKELANADALSRRTYDGNEIIDDDEFESQIEEKILPPSVTNEDILTSNVVRHRTSKTTKKVVPNQLTRKPSPNRMRGRRTTTHTQPVIQYPTITWSTEHIRTCQRKDPKTLHIINYLEDDLLPDDDKLAREILLTSSEYLLDNGILYHVLDTKRQNIQRQVDQIRVCLVIPPELKYDVLMSVHGDLPAGHYGTQRTYTTLRLRYFWRGMYNDTKNWVLSCEQCNTRKTPTKPIKAELQPLPAVPIGQRWAMDFINMPLTSKGNRCILTFTEYNSRYVEAFALPDSQSKTVAHILVDEICARYGPPMELLSDCGANLLAAIVEKTCQLLKIKRLYTTPYHPQTNALLERFNDTLCKNLAMFVNADHNDWDESLKLICFSYNTSVCTDSTGFTPFYLMFGRDSPSFLDTSLPTVTSGDDPEWAHFIKRLSKAREIAIDNVTKRQTKIKERYDETSNHPNFQEGDLVWVYFPEIKVGGTKKFFHNYSGPYVLLQQSGPTNFRIGKAESLVPLKHEVHVNRMKRFVHRTIKPPPLADLPTVTTIHDETDLCDNTSEPLPQNVQDTTKHLLENTNTDPPSTKINTRRESLLPPTNEEPVFLIDKIIRGRYKSDGSKEYLVHWKGYPKSGRTWEPYDNLNDFARTYVNTHKIPFTGKRAVTV